MEIKPEQDPIEVQLRDCAPVLPHALRSQVLQRCEEARRRKPVFAWSAQWRMAGALGGFLLVCLLANGWLDAQNDAILHGTDTLHPGSAQAIRPDSLALMEVRGESLFAALRWRMQQMALLLEERHSS